MQNDLDRETTSLQELEAQKQDAQDRLEEMDQQKHKLEDILNEIRVKCQEESQMVRNRKCGVKPKTQSRSLYLWHFVTVLLFNAWASCLIILTRVVISPVHSLLIADRHCLHSFKGKSCLFTLKHKSRLRRKYRIQNISLFELFKRKAFQDKSSWLESPSPPDLKPPESDPLPGVRLAVPRGRAEPGEGRPGPAAAGRESAGAEPGCWKDPAGDHHQVSEGHTGWDQPGRKLRENEYLAVFAMHEVISHLSQYIAFFRQLRQVMVWNANLSLL